MEAFSSASHIRAEHSENYYQNKGKLGSAANKPRHELQRWLKYEWMNEVSTFTQELYSSLIILWDFSCTTFQRKPDFRQSEYLHQEPTAKLGK